MEARKKSIRYFLFLFFGLERTIPPRGRNRQDMLVEPDVSRAYRRNILALAGIVSMAGFAGANPQELSLFGIGLSGDRGILVLGLGIVLTHLYWFFMRYHSLKEDGLVEIATGEFGLNIEKRKISIPGLNAYPVRKNADLISNYVAVTLTGISWYFVMGWMGCF